MKLKSFGCSFIYGTDLLDDGRGFLYATPSQFTWPSLLAKDLGYDYECYARAGAGNLRILEKILTQTTLDDPTIFVIGWSWMDRFDYTVETTERIVKTELIRAEMIGNETWKTIMPVDSDSRAHSYYRDLHSHYRDKLTNLIYIKTAIDTLKQKNIPFIMTYIDYNLFDTQHHISTAVKSLQDFIQPYMTAFEGKNFLDYSKEKGFPISETLHPLEAAHQSAFELIKSYNLT